mgnify:FL=1
MMNNILKKSAFASLLFTLVLGGCTSDFENINTDPDALPKGEPSNILGYSIREKASREGGYDATETWAGYQVKIQYMDNYNYIPTNNTYGNKFYNCYNGIELMNDILANTESSASELKNIRWVARIWSQYLWLTTTDEFGDIPFTEANKVAEGIIKPKYDRQADIYPAILSELKAVADEMSAGLGSDALGSGDFLFNGKIALWQKFCNSLRLRAAMRIVNVAPDLAKSTIEEIGQNLSKYPILDSSADNAYFYWQGSKPYNEPWYDNALSRDDYGMSNIFVAHMTKMEDPRISSIMKPAASDGQYRGYENGALSAPANLTTISRVGSMYRNEAAGFTPFLKSCENYFILAEAAQRGWNVGISAKDAYEKAVRISMDDNGIESAEADKYLAGKGKFDNTLERIYMEEWVALFKEDKEAWSLYRRTGYPKEIQTSGEYPGKFCLFGNEHTDVPFRMPYPNNEYVYNKENIGAVTSGIVDNTWGDKMWWDTRTGVK